ncbi:MAG: hypothetical protein H6624_00500 [Bdellovibrionaceae bacterium]|nr:hypothetical protein [Bdellovibrionales bacterium]MCB9082787.1 hypothetical protein [Pseudobdellovibrionaceae bacterium]
MSLHKHLLLACLAASFGMTGCNKTPKQYQADPPPQFKRDLNQVPTKEKLGEPTNPGGGISGNGTDISPEEKVRRIRENSQKPIVYGVDGGGGGITFKTEYGQSKDILSKPFYGPDDDGLAAYEENIWVYWRKDKPRTPFGIFFNPGYLGSIDLGLKDASNQPRLINIADELADLFVGDPSGKELIKKVYRHLEKVEDPSFDCLKAGVCQVDDSGQQFLQFSMPRAVMLFSQDDRRSLFRIILLKAEDPGNFANDADLIQAKILIPAGEGTPADSIGVGMSWGEAKEKAGTDTDNTLSTRAFVKGFQGLGVVISKSSFDRNYFFPSADEKLNGLYFTKDFQHSLLFNGKQLKLTKNLDGGLDVSLGCGEEQPDAAAAPEASFQPMSQTMMALSARSAVTLNDAVSIMNEVSDAEKEKERLAAEVAKRKPSACLATKVPFLKEESKLQKDLVKKLALELIGQMSSQPVAQADKDQVLKAKTGTMDKGDKQFLWSFTGFDAQGTNRTFAGLVSAWQPAEKSGINYAYELDEKTGNIFLSLEKITNPIAEITVPATFEPIVAGSQKMGGFALGDQVKIKNIDLGREQATLVVEKDGKTIETRVTYDPTSKMRLQYLDGDKLKEGDQIMEAVGTENLGLGLHRVASEGIGEEQVLTLEIDAISIGTNGKGIEGLCGLPNFRADLGVKDTHFVASLLKATEKAKIESIKAKEKDLRILKKMERIAQGSGETMDPVEDALTEDERAYRDYQGCKFDSPLDPNGSGLNVRYYFPNQRMLLSFDDTDDSGMDRELGGLTIYKRPEEKVGGAQ